MYKSNSRQFEVSGHTFDILHKIYSVHMCVCVLRYGIYENKTLLQFFSRLREGVVRLLVNCVPMREQRTAKLTLKSVFDILKLTTFFLVSSQKVTLSDEVNLNAYSFTSATFCKKL